MAFIHFITQSTVSFGKTDSEIEYKFNGLCPGKWFHLENRVMTGFMNWLNMPRLSLEPGAQWMGPSTHLSGGCNDDGQHLSHGWQFHL